MAFYGAARLRKSRGPVLLRMETMGTVYSDLKFLQFQDHIAAVRDGRVVAPAHIRLKPTNRCNHNCWYCCYRTDKLVLGEDMIEADVIPEAKMTEIVDDIVDMGVKAVTFSGGGEPLIYKPLPRMIERLAKGGVRVATLTNGVNLKNRVADALAEHATWVRVSIDGWDNASYTRLRGAGEGEFDRVIANMRAFAARRSACVLGVSFIVMRENVNQLHDFCALMKDVGVHHVKLSGVVVANDVAANNFYHDQMAPAARSQIDKALGLNDGRFAVIDHYHRLDTRFAKSYTRCPFLLFLTVIGADCRVYSCQDKAYTNSGLLGSIRERSFKDFWFSEENRQRILTLDPSLQCRHHCVAHHKNLGIFDYLSLEPGHSMFV
jgi:MoaA/NifB/PqqE/SkfB family radical SAM enzyme